MITIAFLIRAIGTNYSLIMDVDRNPLWRLPPAQRFQTMTYLAFMWTTIFCAAWGAWFRYGELILAHMLIVLGVVLTSITFRRAEHAPIIPR